MLVKIYYVSPKSHILETTEITNLLTPKSTNADQQLHDNQ